MKRELGTLGYSLMFSGNYILFGLMMFALGQAISDLWAALLVTVAIVWSTHRAVGELNHQKAGAVSASDIGRLAIGCISAYFFITGMFLYFSYVGELIGDAGSGVIHPWICALHCTALVLTVTRQQWINKVRGAKHGF